MTYKLNENGKVCNAETGNRAYYPAMLAQKFFMGNAGAAKFQEYLFARNIMPAESAKKEPTPVLLIDKGSEKNYSPEQIGEMLTVMGFMEKFIAAERRVALAEFEGKKETDERKLISVKTNLLALPRIMELMAYGGELGKYSVKNYLLGSSVGDWVNDETFLLIVMAKLQYNGCDGALFRSEDGKGISIMRGDSLLDMAIGKAINAKKAIPEDGEALQKAILGALEGYPELARYAAKAFETGLAPFGRRGVPTEESYLFKDGEKNKMESLVDEFVRRGLMIRNPATGKATAVREKEGAPVF